PGAALIPARRSAPSPFVVHVFCETFDPFEPVRAPVIIAGCERAVPCSEALIGVAGEYAQVHPALLVVEGSECCIQPAAEDPPRFLDVRKVVLPCEFRGDLVQAPIDEHGVLGGTGAIGPLSAHLDPVDAAPARPGAGAPVPRDVVRPPAAPVIKHRPRATGNLVILRADLHPTVGGPGDVFDRVLESSIAPRHDDG